jgi:hypothetical protein
MSKRWSNKDVARKFGIPEDVVRRIYGAVQIARKQGLYGGHTADLIERGVGRKLVGNEYSVAALAKDHLGHAPPPGYGGPAPTGSAKAPPRATDQKKLDEAGRMVSGADAIIRDITKRRERQWSPLDRTETERLKDAADILDVAADLYEEAGAKIRAGTLHERAKLARRHDFEMLAIYD